MAVRQFNFVFDDDDPEALASSTEGPTFGISRDPVSNLGSGIYQIVCTPTGKVYVGSAINIAGRWGCHLRDLAANRHHSRYLQRAWIKHGPTAFAFAVIEWVEVNRLIEREQHHIDATCAAVRSYGFNLSPTAGSNLGVVASAATRRKISQAGKGRKLGPMREEHRRKIGRAKTGQKLSEETRRKISAANSGRKQTEEHRRKNSEALTGRKRGPMSVETRRKIGQANSGRKPSEENRRKLREVWLGRKHTEETKQKMREARARQVP